MVDTIKNAIQHKRSTVAGNKPTADQISTGEIGINFADRSIYTKDGSGVITELARDVWRTSTQPDSAMEGDFWFNSSTKGMKVYDGTNWNDIYVDVTIIDSALDSEHAWNVTEHAALQASIDSEHSWNVTEHAGLQASIDSEHSWNVTEHAGLQGSIDSNRTESLAGDATLRQRLDELTTDSVAEGSNLYYTDARVDARIDTAIDSDFLNGRMPIDNLSDVQINTPTLNNGDVLEWNGSVWTNREIGITSTVVFRGTVDATTETAPSATNGDFYINTINGTADASWAGLTSVDSGDGLVWDSDATNWRNVGGISSGAIVRVQAGTAIEVDETDPVRPVVAVRQDITDTWYYTQAQIDSAADSARGQNVAENAALQASIDSEHSWNVAEHNALQASMDSNRTESLAADASLQSSLDSEHSWNVAEHNALQASIIGGGDIEWAWVADEYEFGKGEESVHLGYQQSNFFPSTQGTSVGYNAFAGMFGIAIGWKSYATSSGMAIGVEANAAISGIALGQSANALAQEFAISPSISKVNFSNSTVQAKDYLDSDGNSIVYVYDSDVIQAQIDSSLENILVIDASPSGGVSNDF